MSESQLPNQQAAVVREDISEYVAQLQLHMTYQAVSYQSETPKFYG